MCRICYSVDNRLTDIGVTGKTAAATANASVKGTKCCGYGLDGAGPGTAGGGDCLIIPGAEKNSSSNSSSQRILLRFHDGTCNSNCGCEH